MRTWFTRLADASFDAIDEIYETVIAEGRAALASSDAKPARGAVARTTDMRYVGQEHPVTIELLPELFRRRDRAGIKARFDAVHRQRYGASAPEEPSEIVILRATVTGVMKKPAPERIERGGRALSAAVRRGTRNAYFAESRAVHAL